MNIPPSRRFLPFLLMLFAGSGCAALIYEIVWFQLLQLVLGSTAVSLGVLLGTFMGGMCLGSLALARFVSARQHPLRVYAMLELGIGLLGIVVLFIVPALGKLYAPHAGAGLGGVLLRGVIGAICLLPPTLLMGATLPAIARWVDATPRGVSWLGFFYGGNIGGAVLGCLLAGFYLLRVHDMGTATFVAVAINGTVAMLGFGLASFSSHQPTTAAASSTPAVEAGTSWGIYLVIGLSGLCALGAEVIWTRLLSLMLGPTVYTFSIILAVFLIGLGMGSSAGSFLARRTARPRLALGWCQMLLACAIAWSACMIAKSLPYWPINPSLSKSPWFIFQLDVLRCAWAILPATCLWGASFPLALAAAARGEKDPGRLVGKVYAANTVGAIVGAIGCSIVLVAWVGTQQVHRLLIGLSMLAALLILAPSLWRSAGRAAALLAVIACSLMLVLTVPNVPWGLLAYGRYLPTKPDIGQLLYRGEGMNASVAVSELGSGVRNFHVSGKVEASTEATDMRLQRMLAHLPALLHAKPRSALVVGCGAGVTAGSFVAYPDIERIVICEIEPLIPTVVAQYFGKENYNVMKDPRTEVVYDDARHYIFTTREKFDIITSDPIHPWVKGVATLYTREYYELVKQHLNPGGVVAQWVPLYESSSEAVKSEIATFFEVFPQGTIWGNDQEGEGYDSVLIGQAEPGPIDVEKIEDRLQREETVAQSLKDVGIRSAIGLLGTYAGQGPDLAPWLKQAQINRDRNLRLQYLAGLGVNLEQAAKIYDDILRYRKYPEKLFRASELHERMLRMVIEPSKGSAER